MDKIMVKSTCVKCGKEFELSERASKTRVKKGTPNYCKPCMKEYLNKLRSEYFSNLSEEEKQKYVEKRNWYAKSSDEDKEKFKEKMRQIEANKTDEERAEANRKNSEGLKKHWSTVSQKDKEARIHNMHASRREFFASMTPEERSEYMKKRFYALTKEQQDRVRNMGREQISKYNDSLSYEEKLERVKRMQEWHKNLTPEQKDELYQRTHQWYYDLSDEEKALYSINKRELYDNMDPDEKSKRLKRALANHQINNLNSKFEDAFINSYIANTFYFVGECVMINNDIAHSWDYGIYNENGELVMLVDLDGAYYHADSCDYDCIHSKEEYDEKRSLSVPYGIKICIINELTFNESFNKMIQELLVDYDKYIDDLFNEYRSMPFPNPQYTDEELIKSFNKLQRMNCNDEYHKDISLNSRLGDRLIQHFHPSIYSAHRRGKVSPYDAWYDDDLLKKCIRNRILYQRYINPNKILQGFNVSKIAMKVSVFSAARAKLLINKYLNYYDIIYDPFSGFSGRMLGAISLGKKYIGQDISEIHVRESNQMMQFLKDHGIEFDATIMQKNVLQSYGEYPCLFTCPPYSDKEIWENVPADTRSCDDWVDICIERFKCKRYVFVVDKTVKYKDHVVDEIVNKSHFNRNKEYVIMIDRGY